MQWQSSGGDFLAEPAVTPGTRAAIVCDDVLAAMRGQQILARLEFDRGFQVDQVLWLFDQLNSAQSRVRAADDLADADYVIVSLSRPHRVPDHVGQWLEPCLSARHPRSVTSLTQAGTRDGWTIEFRDQLGVLTSRSEFAVRDAPRNAARTAFAEPIGVARSADRAAWAGRQTVD